MSSFKIDDILSGNKRSDQFSVSSSSSSCSSSSFSTHYPPAYPNNIEKQLLAHFNTQPSSFYDMVLDMRNPHQQILAYAQAQLSNELASYVGLGVSQFAGQKEGSVSKKREQIGDKTDREADLSAANTDTSNKLKLVDKYAKKIDELNESSLKKSGQDKPKAKKNGKKADKRNDKKANNNDYRCGCDDFACSLSSVIDQSQLPMCLRGTSEEQLHLASLFNTLMHHKKCRRTRTVFTDLQLIGLEKRFENQKYLSTPDRIQLAESLGLSQLQVKTWYQNRRMKWKKKVLKEGSHEAPTKPKGRPKKNSIPSFSDIIKANAAAAAETSIDSSSVMKNSSTENLTDLNENLNSTNDDDDCCEEMSEEDDESDLSVDDDEDGRFSSDDLDEYDQKMRLTAFIKENGFNFVK